MFFKYQKTGKREDYREIAILLLGT